MAGIGYLGGSIAFLDIETTGFVNAHITELALWILPQEEFIFVENGDRPRRLHKWSMAFNPVIRVHPRASEITGLDNDMLSAYNTFDEDIGNALISYLSHCPRPVYLVAHNGRRFDFPIVKRALTKTMPNYVLCCDSLDIFKNLENYQERRYSQTHRMHPQRRSFKLCDIYERVFGLRPSFEHTAEGDVEALYKLAGVYGEEFSRVADEFAIPFKNIRG